MRNKHFLLTFLLVAFCLASCKDSHGIPPTDPGDKQDTGELASYKGEKVVPLSPEWDGKKRADITYQLLVYSFADTPTDTDNVGDLKGIKEKLDYLDAMGVSALWLSPIHPCVSYHGYGVSDYFAVKDVFGSERDLKDLIDEAHKHDIKVYLDYVLNHCGSDNPWFVEASSDENSPYRDWFAFSRNPSKDIEDGKIAQITTQGADGYSAEEWRKASGNTGYSGPLKFHLDFSDERNPTVTVTKASMSEIDAENTVESPSDKYIHYDSKSSRKRLYNKGNGIYELTFDFHSNWGFLVTSAASGWPDKYGSPQKDTPIEFGVPFKLSARTSSFDPSDILFDAPWQWHSNFRTDRYADFNFGPAMSAESSPAFKELLASAEHWIKLGIDGLRLDAVKHIYRNTTNEENPIFLGKWYEATNELYKSCGNGRQEEFYTVGEVLTSKVENVAPYYKGLPALFEFAFWTKLRDGINNGEGYQFVDQILGYRQQYAQFRKDFIEPTKLSNHDEKRTGSELGRSAEKMRLAAAVLLTAGGSPYIYQGEELGYWGEQNNGDEYVRTPILWDKAKNDCAKGLLGGKIDEAMLQSKISVEAQLEDANSLLNTYRTFGQLRNTCPALAYGSMERHPQYNSSASGFNQICAYYRVCDNQKLLVVHNFGSKPSVLKLSDKLDKAIAVSGNAKVLRGDGKDTLTLGAYASVVFDLQ